jgi:hypothetical protein
MANDADDLGAGLGTPATAIDRPDDVDRRVP